MSSDLRNAALVYAGEGWRVLPNRPRSKKPILRDWTNEASSDPETIERWWKQNPDANVGLLTERRLVVDVDPDKGGNDSLDALQERIGQLPETRRHATGGGGFHLIFSAPGEGVPTGANVLGDGIDIRGNLGQIVAPPSVHESGRRYRLLSDAPIVEAPNPLVEAVLVGCRKHQAGGRFDVAAMFEGVPEGERDERFFRFACSLQAKGVPVEEAIAQVTAAWQRAEQGSDPFPLDAALEKVHRAYERYDPPEPKAGGEKKASQADLLVALADECFDVFLSKDGEAFGVDRRGPHIARPLRGTQGLRPALSAEFYKRLDKVPQSGSLTDACMVLEGRAMAADRRPVHLRVAEHEDSVVLDLADDSGAVVVIGADGWQVRDKSPVLFRRTALSSPLPHPEPGGDINELTELLNIDDESWPLLVAWLVAALVPDIPHPIVLLRGEQGTGKTTAGRMLSRLVDPSPAQVRTAPRNVDQWINNAWGSWVVALDNVSAISAEMSDALCRAVTGDGNVKRKLYTDNDNVVVSFRRVVLLTAIDTGALRSDLADRMVFADLERIGSDKRLLDADLEDRFEEMWPRLLGALCDLASNVLRTLPGVHLEEHPRMADFARVVRAVDLLRGTNALHTYMTTAANLAEEVVYGDPVADAVRDFVLRHGHFKGSAEDLLGRLHRPDPIPRSWPAGPQPLSAALKRAAPALRQLGLLVEWGRTREGRYIELDRQDRLGDWGS